YSSNGYSIRTEGIAEGLSENGLDVTVAARAGYPWDDGHRLPEQRIERRHRGILYVHNPAKPLVSSSLKASIDEIADAFVREARRSRPATIHAASDFHTGIGALIAARRVGVPFVYEVRGLWEITEASTIDGWEESDRFALK